MTRSMVNRRLTAAETLVTALFGAGSYKIMMITGAFKAGRSRAG